MSGFWTALVITLFAGLSTGIGGLAVVLKRKFSSRFLSLSLGFSAGVMIYISLTEIFAESNSLFATMYGSKQALLFTAASFLAGMLLIALIDRMIPDKINPHELSNINSDATGNVNTKKLLKSGMMVAVAVGVHNFPEGITTFTTAINDISLGIPIAIAIAIHNIPEGIAVAVPIYQASGSKGRAFLYALISGISEPIGGMIGYLILSRFITDTVMAVIFGMVAGIMVYISLDELLPLSHEYGEEHTSIYGIMAGFAVMAVSLVLFA
ncbi:MAG: zinc transporter ZupT [Clostridiales bacterium]|nr:zinc transporter ZupT [Clostridiales bacterium]